MHKKLRGKICLRSAELIPGTIFFSAIRRRSELVRHPAGAASWAAKEEAQQCAQPDGKRLHLQQYTARRIARVSLSPGQLKILPAESTEMLPKGASVA